MPIKKDSFIYKYYLYLLLFIPCSYKAYSQEIKENQNQTLIASFDLQGGFKNDTVSLLINTIRLFDKIVTTSNLNDFTGISVRVEKTRKGKVKLRYDKQTKNLDSLTGSLNVTLIINGIMSKFHIDLARGKYIGFSKSGDLVELDQLDRKMYYD